MEDVVIADLLEGFVSVHRRLLKSPIFKNPFTSHYFIYCLLKANYKNTEIIWNKASLVIERGSFITGLHLSAEETGLSVQNVRTAQQTLCNLGIIKKSTSKSTSKFTYITVCNYNKYQQAANKQVNKQPTSSQQAANKQPTTE